LDRAAADSHASGVLDKALCFLPAQEQADLASEILKIDGLLGRMVVANRPAAERLLRVVTGPWMAEAKRQLTVAFPDLAARNKALKSVFGSGKIPCCEECAPVVNPGVTVLLAPQPMSMVEDCAENFFPLSVPLQMSMANVPSIQAQEDDTAWWSTTVNQVFALWSNDQFSDPMNHHHWS